MRLQQSAEAARSRVHNSLTLIESSLDLLFQIAPSERSLSLPDSNGYTLPPRAPASFPSTMGAKLAGLVNWGYFEDHHR
jgi:hypothetical protein